MGAASLSRVSIRWILPLAVVLPVLLVAGALTLLAYRTMQATAHDLAGQNMRQIHSRIEAHLTKLLDLPPAINELNKLRLASGELSLGEPARNRESVFQTLRIFPDVSSIVLGKATGEVMWVIRYPGEATYEYAIKPSPQDLMREYNMDADGRVVGDELSAFEFKTTGRPWYTAAIAADGPTWGDVYVWVRNGKGETLGVSYVEPYRDDQGHVLGVINCELTLADISAFLGRLEIGKTGDAFIIERDGNLVANSLDADCMKNGTGRVAAIESSDPRIADAALQLSNHFGPLESITGQHRAQIQVAGQPAQVVVSSFTHRRNLDWLIVTVVPDADFLADAYRNRTQSTIVALIAVVIALGLGMLVALWLLRPILAVVQHAQRVGEGDLDARLNRQDNTEIAQLSAALNDMADGLKDRMRLRHALSLAMEVQQSLLPSHKPKVRGVDVAARSKYCDETGGDYYDYLEVEGMGPHTLFVALGDVMGHGIAAAMLMATARGILRSHVRVQGSLGHLLTHVNELLVADTDGRRFMTMFLGVMDVSTMALRWASAGHDPPLLYDPQGGAMIELETGGGLPLGVLDTETYDEHIYADLRPGQIMVIGTDGLWESKNDANEQFGKQRVGHAIAELAHLDAAGIEAGLYQRLQAFCGGRANDDDITYVVIKFTAHADSTRP